MKKFFLVFLSLGYGFLALAADQLPGDKYFLIKDSDDTIDFMAWTQFNTPAPKPAVKYDRVQDFGIWVDFAQDTSCLTTRGLVLERDTKVPIQLYVFPPLDPTKPPPPPPIFPNACYVDKGLWYDPYTDAEYSEANALEIDHVVPLKQAYISGASEWSWRKRCAYFNFLGNPLHLIAIEKHTNTAKLDHGPERWMPPNTKYHCQYISNWLRVKAIWQLKMSEPETTAITTIAKNLQCDSNLFKMTQKELLEQRKIAETIAGECPEGPPPPKAPVTAAEAR